MEIIKPADEDFKKSICLCFVIFVACVSALVGVRFNSHLFPLHCLIKGSHTLIDGLEMQLGPSASVQCDGTSAAAV